MSKTSLLPPMTAVQMTWALTGLFSKEKPTQNSDRPADSGQEDTKNSEKKDKKRSADSNGNHPKEVSSPFPTFLTDKALEDMKIRAKNDKENKYVDRVLAAMNASLRSIHTIYKGRNLNFDENEELRAAYLKSMKESIDYGFRVKDILKSLPTASIGAAGGLTLTSIMDGFKTEVSNEPVNGTNILSFVNKVLSNVAFRKFLLVTTFAVLGFFVGWVFIWWRGRKTWKLYVIRDYERNLYFRLYLRQVTTILESLYESVCQIYLETFGETCPEEEKGKEMIGDMMKGMKPNLCKCVDRHMRENKITANQWAMCETGDMDIIKRRCPVWKKEKRKLRLSSSYRKAKRFVWNLLYVSEEDDRICDSEKSSQNK
jgi:hypothetical protein